MSVVVAGRHSETSTYKLCGTAAYSVCVSFIITALAADGTPTAIDGTVTTEGPTGNLVVTTACARLKHLII